MPKTVFFIRHAQSHPCPNTHFSSWPLSDLGHQQSAALANLLPPLGIKKIYSSPFRRCLETVGPFCEDHDIEIEIHEDLRERLICHGIADRDMWVSSWTDFDFSLERCESSRVAQQRFLTALTQIVKSSHHETIAISSHGNVIALFLNYLDAEYSRLDAESILNPHVLKVDFENGEFSWDRSFEIEDLKSISTCHSKTPIRL